MKGNNYRFHREQIRQKDCNERKAQSKKWLDIYRKAIGSEEKAYGSE
mgnify:FL=1